MTRTRTNLSLATALLIPTLFLSSCTDRVAGPSGSGQYRTEESDLMALALSDQVAVPEELSERIATDLNTIRTRFRDDIPDVDHAYYTPPWVPQSVLMEITDELRDAIAQGDTSAFESINAEWNAKFGEMSRFPGSELGATTNRLTVKFDGSYHPARIAEQYSEVDGVLNARAITTLTELKSVLRNVYASVSGGSIYYLVRESTAYRSFRYRDRFWYVRCGESGCQYMGSFEPGGVMAPLWWADAKQSLDTGLSWPRLIDNWDAD